MAAYAAVVSLFNTLNHPHFSASFDQYQIESLAKHINFLLDFVESYNIDGDLSKEAQQLRRHIVSAAHEAEDIIESHIVNQILPQSAEISDARLHHRCLFGLQKVIQDMNSIKEKVVKFKEEKPSKAAASSTLTPPSSEQNMRMVGFEDELMQLKDVLIVQQSRREIISIVGMGGSGKTTLAKHVYEDSLTLHHFDLRAWATISQQYDARDVLLQLLSVVEGTLSDLGEHLHRKLFGRRYLIVLDDMWDMEVLNRLKIFFPDNGDGSRIILTTRLANMATLMGSICTKIKFLDEGKSWNLFCQKIFGQEDCPVELEGIGKMIVKHCKGLPLSIVVIGGLLKKSHMTKEYWKNVAKSINVIFNSRENGQCLDVLYLSYSHLPAHLKPCFLYMGTFKEDSDIDVVEIINLWVAEGFLKPNGVQILEEMAEDYLKDLINRNLILACMHGSNGKIRSFRIHDLLRELCLRVAHKEEFFCVVGADSIPGGIDKERRLIFHHQTSSYFNNQVFEAFQSASLAHSLICNVAEAPVKCRLLRVLNKALYWSPEAELQNVNLRYVACQLSTLPSSISLMWNLQTLVIVGANHLIVAPLEIWKLTQLRHLNFDSVLLPDPPPCDDKDDFVVLQKLQTLRGVVDFKLSEEVCKRIPNIKRMSMRYGYIWQMHDNSVYDNLQNLGHLQRLESLNLWCFHGISISQLMNTFPSSLKKLSLRGSFVLLEDLSMIIGSLPQLEFLKLRGPSKRFQKWICVEGGFLSLKFLSIKDSALESWTLNSVSCFPILEKLVLICLRHLNEIPSVIGEIPTLQLIRMEDCSESLVISAMKIKEEQESFGNDGLQIQVKMRHVMREQFMQRVSVEGLSIENIHIEYE